MQRQQSEENSRSDDDEVTNRNHIEARGSSDGLEFVPTILKIKEIIFLRHSEFTHLVNEFNKTLESFTRDEPYYLNFTIVPQSDSTILWKALIRITCSKVRETSVAF